MQIKLSVPLGHTIKFTTLTLGLALYCLLLTASTQAKTAQNDFSCTAVSEIPQLECEGSVTLYNYFHPCSSVSVSKKML